MADREFHEFDCAECRRHIMAYSSATASYGLCLNCLFLPGWHADPSRRARLAPNLPATTRQRHYHGANRHDVYAADPATRVESPLPLRLDLANHSPTGFAWGYGGCGPTQLALALLADALDDDARALALHVAFKWRVVAQLKPTWTLSRYEVFAHVTAIARTQTGAGREKSS